MSSIDWHRIEVRTWPKRSRPRRICDLIRQCSNPAKCCDDLAGRYTAGKFCSEMHAAECSDGISGKHYLFLTSQSRLNRIRSCHSFRHPPPLPLAIAFDRYLECFQYRRFLVQRNCPLLSAESLREIETKNLLQYLNRCNGKTQSKVECRSLYTDLVKANCSRKKCRNKNEIFFGQQFHNRHSRFKQTPQINS